MLNEHYKNKLFVEEYVLPYAARGKFTSYWKVYWDNRPESRSQLTLVSLVAGVSDPCIKSDCLKKKLFVFVFGICIYFKIYVKFIKI